MSRLVPVTVWLPTGVADRYRTRAAEEDRSLSAECRRTLVQNQPRCPVVGCLGGCDDPLHELKRQ